jgi:glyoxylase-like metal-dependent hydrolase (beta-lactamase superfamily II)
LISHAIPNHFGGALSVIQMHDRLNLPLPKIFKKLNGNNYEMEVFTKFPELREHVINTLDGDEYKVKEAEGIHESIIRVLETPGHRSDHCSFQLENKQLQQNILFAGDMILGSPSVTSNLIF